MHTPLFLHTQDQKNMIHFNGSVGIEAERDFMKTNRSLTVHLHYQQRTEQWQPVIPTGSSHARDRKR